MNAENFRQTVCVDLGSPTAAKTLAALFANCAIRVKKLTMINGAAITQSGTNFAQIDLKNGATVLASVDSKLGLTALAGRSVAVPVASQDVPAGATLSVSYVIGGTQASAALADCRVQIEFVRAENK